ncbi:hypothetical protein [Endozoicomonas atrinae]|uniref:hypothetical protein n=1 Tax=Endozoicomonas atrinae TaxID=1333660 RepID=UPI000826E1D6|nr:hypothetical protein [Endozoicomonas atrinae]
MMPEHSWIQVKDLEITIGIISQRISGAAGFYSSQIRHYTDIDPSFPICLLFPKDERHFSVTELIEVVEKKQNVAVLQSDFLHGFMNTDSPNYDHSAYLYYLKALSRLPSNRCFRSLKDVVDAPISVKALCPQ